MKKRSVFVFLAMVVISGTVLAQGEDPNVFTSADGRNTKRLMKVVNPENDKTDLYEINAIGTTTFTTSNTADGSANSYKHSQKIIMSLQVPGKPNTVQLVFFSANTDMPFAAAEESSKVNVYFPISLYTEIREKLEQSLAARKKVQVKVFQGKNGFREGTLAL